MECEGFAQNVRNTTHGSGWILSDRLYEVPSRCDSGTPPTAVGGLFRSFLQKQLPQNSDASRGEQCAALTELKYQRVQLILRAKRQRILVSVAYRKDLKVSTHYREWFYHSVQSCAAQIS